MARRLILLQGPPRSGKDCCYELASRFYGFEKPIFKRKFSSYLKVLAHQIFSHGEEEDHFEDVKDVPMPNLNGMSWRQVYILVSEKCCKVAGGNQFFGKKLAEQIQLLPPDSVTFVPDSGFLDEALPVAWSVGYENCLLVQLHRAGRTFAGDSRGYWHLHAIETLRIDNNGTKEDLFNALTPVFEWAGLLQPTLVS